MRRENKGGKNTYKLAKEIGVGCLSRITRGTEITEIRIKSTRREVETKILEQGEQDT